VKRYEYRLVLMEFDGTWKEGQTNGCATQQLEPGERIFKVLGEPEHSSVYNVWYLSVLVEKETTCFPIHDMDQDKLTAILRGKYEW
jgi:hypothetical protein